jgi:glycolate oxidase iron-sulfur subunit
MHLLTTGLAERPSAVFENLFSHCLLCGACEQVCPRHLPVTDIVSKARSRFSRFYGPNGLKKAAACAVLSQPRLLEGLVRAGISLRRIRSLPDWSGLRLKLGLLEERPVIAPSIVPKLGHARQKGQIDAEFSYFTGCFARHLQPSIAVSTHDLLARCDLTAHIPADQYCCGLAAWSAGRRDQARELARKNIQAFSTAATADRPIITSCASCSSCLLAYPALFAENDPWHQRAKKFAERIQEFTDFFGIRLPAPSPTDTPLQRIFYHDPCHLRFTQNGMTAPRSLLKKIGFQLVESNNVPLCCGQGGLFHLACPEMSDKIFQKCGDQPLADRPDCITTTCSGCLMQYQEGLARQKKNIRVAHMAVLLADFFQHHT